LNFSEAPPPHHDEGALAAYLRAIRAHPVVVVAITLATIGASALFLAARSSTYEATAELLVSPLPQDDQTFRGLPMIRDTGDPVRTAQTAASLVETREVAQEAADDLGGNRTADSVLAAVEVEPVGESNILGITAEANDADAAAELANAVAASVLAVREREIQAGAVREIAALNTRIEAVAGNDVAEAELIARRDQLETVVAAGDPTLAQAQEAVPPIGPIGASGPIIIALAAIAGFVLGSAAAILLELGARRVRDEEDAIAVYPLPVLLRVPSLPPRKRRGPPGATWYMPPEIREPFRTLAVQLDQPDGASVLMVTSPTAGDGKTTTVVNLAVSLAAAGNSVVLLDFDLRKPQVASALGLNHGIRMAELLDPGGSLEPHLQTPSHLGELRVLAPSTTPEETEWIEAMGFKLPELLEEARGLAEFVIVDTAPLGEVGDALRLVNEVEDILVVVRPGNTYEPQLELLRDLLERAGRRPSGYVMLSGVERHSPAYYSYGYVQPRAPAAERPEVGGQARPAPEVPAGHPRSQSEWSP